LFFRSSNLFILLIRNKEQNFPITVVLCSVLAGSVGDQSSAEDGSIIFALDFAALNFSDHLIFLPSPLFICDLSPFQPTRSLN
jgi:hypothetical protein